MRKLAIYLLSIAGVLWAVHPAALAAAEQGENGYSVSHDTDSESVVSTADAAEALAEDPVIKVDVPGKGEMVINPYCLTVELDGGTITDQIFNKEQILVNHSKVPVIVGVSVTAETSEGSTLAITNQPIEPGESDKLAYLYVEFQDLPNEDSVPSWAGAYTGAFNQILVSPDGSATGDVLRLEAGDNVPVRAAYRLFGSLSSYPLDEWESGDGLTVTVRFTFREEGEISAAAEPLETPDEPKQETDTAEEENWLTPGPESEPEEDFREDGKSEWLVEEPDPEPEEEVSDTDTDEPWLELEPEPEPEPEPGPEEDPDAQTGQGWLTPEPEPDAEPEEDTAAERVEGWLTPESETPPEPEPDPGEGWFAPGTETEQEPESEQAADPDAGAGWLTP